MQEKMKRFGDTAAGKMQAADLYPQRKWIRASDILEVPFVLVRANTGKAKNGNQCAYLTVNFQRIPARITDSNNDPLNRYDEYTISHQGAKIIGRIAHMTTDDFPCGPVCFVEVSVGDSTSKSHDLWDFDELEALQASEQMDDNPFMESAVEPKPEPEPERTSPKSRNQQQQQHTR